MLTAEWERLYKVNKSLWHQKCDEFFNDEDNAMNCENCPDMILKGKGSGLLPCGRTRCKVHVTTKSRKDKERFIYGK